MFKHVTKSNEIVIKRHILITFRLYIYIYIIFKWRNWYFHRITMTRKSGKHLHMTYGALNSCFDLIRSYQQCTPWSPPLEIEPTTTVCRSRNSTTGPSVHATYKRSELTSHAKLRHHIDQTWEDVALEVVVFYVREICTLRDTLDQKWLHNLTWLVNSAFARIFFACCFLHGTKLKEGNWWIYERFEKSMFRKDYLGRNKSIGCNTYC